MAVLARCYFVLLFLCLYINLISSAEIDKIPTRSKRRQGPPSQSKNNVTLPGQSKCGKDAYREMDNMIARMTSPDDRFPETIKQLQHRCQNRTNLLPKIEDLKNRCMEGLTKRVVAVMIYSMKRQRKTLCRKKPNKRMEEMVGAGKCINSVRVAAQKCIQQAMDHIIGIGNITEHKMKIPYVCCTFVKLKACLLDVGHRSKQCTDEHISLLTRQSEQVSNGPMNMACGDYNEESDRCDQLTIPRRLNTKQPLPKSFLMPLVDLMQGIGQNE